MPETMCEMRGGPKDGLQHLFEDNAETVTFVRDDKTGWVYRRASENSMLFVYVGVCDLWTRNEP